MHMHTINKFLARICVAVLLVMSFATSALATDAKMEVFKKFNKANSYAEVKTLVSGLMGKQLEIFHKKGGDAVVLKVLESVQLTSYEKFRFVDVTDQMKSFLVLEGIKWKSVQNAKDSDKIVFEFSKSSSGLWTIANRHKPESMIGTLWTSVFTPDQFNQNSSCIIDGKDIGAQSAVAFRDKKEGNTIRIYLYPFKLSAPDIDYWKYVNIGPAPAESIHFGYKKRGFASCYVLLRFSGQSKLENFNIGIEDQSSTPNRSTTWQPEKSKVSRFELSANRVIVESTGNVGTNETGVSWNVKLNLPIWEKGL